MEMRVKWAAILADQFGPEILTMLETMGQILHRVRKKKTCGIQKKSTQMRQNHTQSTLKQ